MPDLVPENDPKERKRFKDTLRGWAIGDYLRQLSIVVIGILITFQGSAWIERIAERRDMRSNLEMVSQELEKNLATLDYMEKYVSYERDAVVYLGGFVSNPDAIPVDSLAKYFPVIGRGTSFRFSANSFEVLKNSSAVQAVGNKELLRNLFSIYEEMETLAKNASEYYSMKIEVAQEFFYAIDKKITDAMSIDNNLYPIAGQYMKNNATRNFLTNAEGNLYYLFPVFERVREETGVIIEMIEAETK